MLLTVAALLVTSACARDVPLEPAPSASDPVCAQVLQTTPGVLGGAEQRPTTTQSSRAWGDPAIAIARCGMEPPAPTTDRCVTVDGVDWISTEEAADSWTFVTYGRTPAVEVILDPQKVSGATVLSSVSPAVALLEETSACVGAHDAEQVPELPEE